MNIIYAKLNIKNPLNNYLIAMHKDGKDTSSYKINNSEFFIKSKDIVSKSMEPYSKADSESKKEIKIYDKYVASLEFNDKE